jgi:hypothetical protein
MHFQCFDVESAARAAKKQSRVVPTTIVYGLFRPSPKSKPKQAIMSGDYLVKEEVDLRWRGGVCLAWAEICHRGLEYEAAST